MKTTIGNPDIAICDRCRGRGWMRWRTVTILIPSGAVFSEKKVREEHPTYRPADPSHSSAFKCEDCGGSGVIRND